MVAECRMLNMKYGVPASAGGMLVILMAGKYFKLAENVTSAPAKAGTPYLLQVALGLGVSAFGFLSDFDLRISDFP